MNPAMDVEAWLSDIAEKMAGVVDPAFRAILTARYLGLLQRYHDNPAAAGTLYEEVKSLDEDTSAGLLQYKLQAGLGDFQDGVRQALQQAHESFVRLKRLVSMNMDLALRRNWDDRLKNLAQQLQRYENDLAFTGHTTAHFSKLDQMANRINNLVAVEMLPLELEWSRVLKQKAPVYAAATKQRSGALNIAVHPEIWRQGVDGGTVWDSGQVTMGDAAMDTLDSYNQAVTQAWLTNSADVQRQAEIPWQLFQNSVQRLAVVEQRLRLQTQWLNTEGVKNPSRAEAQAYTLQERIRQYNSLVAEARGLADQMKQVSYNEFDEPEQVVQKMLGGDLPRNKAAVALLFDPQIRGLSTDVAELEKAADAFDRDAGIRTMR